MTLLEITSFPAFGAGVGTARPTSMNRCQFTSAVALLVQAEDVTQAVGNIPPPLSFNIQGIASTLIFGNDIPPHAPYHEMAGLPCVWGYYFPAYNAAVKEKAFLKNAHRKIRQN